MDIFNTKPGDKITCIDNMEHYWGADRGNAEKCALEIGRQYTVENVEIHGWHTNVYLTEFPGIPFNSVQFENCEG